MTRFSAAMLILRKHAHLTLALAANRNVPGQLAVLGNGTHLLFFGIRDAGTEAEAYGCEQENRMN